MLLHVLLLALHCAFSGGVQVPILKPFTPLLAEVNVPPDAYERLSTVLETFKTNVFPFVTDALTTSTQLLL